MARINVYLPDDLAAEVKAAGLNVSSLTQAALRSALQADRADEWIERVSGERSLGIAPAVIVDAVSAAKDELEGHG